MERRRFLRFSGLAGGLLIAGCTSGNSGGETDSSPSSSDAGAESATSDGEDGNDSSESDGEDGEEPSKSDSEDQTDSETDCNDETDSASETLPDSEVIELSGPPCEAIDGTMFKSVEKQLGSPTPEGDVSKGHWIVQFDDDRFQYFFTDQIVSGGYTCTVEDYVAIIEAERETDVKFDGTYDPETNVLVWEEVEYRPVEGSL